MLSAEDIVNKQFKTKRDGYDPDDVDDFSTTWSRNFDASRLKTTD